MKICHLGGPQKFEFTVSAALGSPDEWLIRIRGERSTAITEVTDTELVEYANCREDIQVVQRHINKYGPPIVAERDGEEFLYADTLSRWRGLQLEFRMSWDRILGIEVQNTITETYGKKFPELWAAREPVKQVEAKGLLKYNGGQVIFLAETHYAALVSKLLDVWAAGKLRKCLNPNCQFLPYFIATHGKVQYCSIDCGHWGQKQAKLKYWHEKNRDIGRNAIRPPRKP